MAKRRISDQILKELKRKYPDKTREELLAIRCKVLGRTKVSDLLRKQMREIKKREEDPFSPKNIKKTREVLDKVLKQMNESLGKTFLKNPTSEVNAQTGTILGNIQFQDLGCAIHPHYDQTRAVYVPCLIAHQPHECR